MRYGRKKEDPEGVSCPTFHTDQASTPNDCRPLYVARVRTITVAGGFCINHCARENADRLKEVESKLKSHAYFGDPTGVVEEREGVPVSWACLKPLGAAAFLQEVLVELHTRYIHMSVVG